MTTHELKTDPAVFEAVARGAKTHEIRLNDRGFAVGDTLLLRETKDSGWEMAVAGVPLVYTGRTETRTVSHIQTGYGLADGWCILSFTPAAPVVAEGLTQAAQRFLQCVNENKDVALEIGTAAAHTEYDRARFALQQALAAHPVAGSPAEAENGKRAMFAVDILGNPMREYAPGKWENCVWPSEAEPMPASEGKTLGYLYEYGDGVRLQVLSKHKPREFFTANPKAKSGKVTELVARSTATPVPASEAAGGYSMAIGEDGEYVVRRTDGTVVGQINFYEDAKNIMSALFAAPAAPTDAKPDSRTRFEAWMRSENCDVSRDKYGSYAEAVETRWRTWVAALEFEAPTDKCLRIGTAFSCAKRAADPANEFAACRQSCAMADNPAAQSVRDAAQPASQASSAVFGPATPEEPIAFLMTWKDGTRRTLSYSMPGPANIREIGNPDDLVITPLGPIADQSTIAAEEVRDAARYRHLRDSGGYSLGGARLIGNWNVSRKMRDSEGAYFFGEKLDKMIDQDIAAIASTTTAKG